MSCCGKKNVALTCGVYNALRSPDDGRNTGNALMLMRDRYLAWPFEDASTRPKNKTKTE